MKSYIQLNHVSTLVLVVLTAIVARNVVMGSVEKNSMKRIEETRTASPSVTIVGGGVAGLSAALELIERGYQVSGEFEQLLFSDWTCTDELQVYEKLTHWGGKARSIPVPNSGVNGRPDLPGEHGFRFFPGFYVHLPNTLQRVPYQGSRSAYSNLRNTTKEMLARSTGNPWIFPTLLPKNFSDWWEDFKEILHFQELGIPLTEQLYYLQRCYVMLTSCDRRWSDEYDNYSYWNFTHAGQLSPNYRNYLVKGITRDLVAAKAEISSLKSVGKMFIRLVESAFRTDMDALLNGPTTDTWIDPMVRYLESLGVKLYNNATATEVKFDGKLVTGVTFNDGAFTAVSDHYLFAVPVNRCEGMRMLVNEEMKGAAPSIANLDKLHTDWMNGIMFYLNKETPIVHGHVGYFDSPWALTSISQQQFWDEFRFENYGDGKVRDCISVDISNFFEPGLKDGPSKGLPAVNCTKQQIKDEVWYQMHKHLPGVFPLNQSIVHSWFMDPDLFWEDGHLKENAEPLIVNLQHTWQYRPEAITEIPNMFLASDYVKTDCDVACMEAANEAARRAVNGILQRDGRDDKVQVWQYMWPSLFEAESAADCVLYEKGLKPFGWDFPVPSYNSTQITPELLQSHFQKIFDQQAAFIQSVGLSTQQK